MAASAAALTATYGLAGHKARAAVYVFDPGLSTTGGTDGSGAFDGTTADFFNTASGTVGMFGNTTADTAVFGSGGNAGTVTVGTVTVGTIDFNQVIGSYNLTGGTITLGGAATIFADTGVTATIGSAITGTAVNKTGAGTVSLTGAGTFAGFSTIASGTLVLGGGVTDTFNNQIAVGSGASPAGTSAAAPNFAVLNIASGTTVNFGGNSIGLGNGDGAANQFLVLNVNGTLNTTNQLFSGYQSSATTTAVINVNPGGVISANNMALSIAAGVKSVLNLSGGSLTITNAIANARGLTGANAGSSTAVNISGGTLTIPSYFYLTNAAGTTTTVTQTGGTFNATGTGTDGLFFSTGTGTYNLAGGVLSTTNVKPAGTPTAGSIFIFNGGTVQVRTATGFGASGFFNAPVATIGANGGTFDTNGINSITTQAFTSGVIGGTDGGLAKIGAGSLTFTGVSTYTGPTNVTGGTLIVGTAGSINNSSRINVNGTGAGFVQTSTAASTPAIMLTTGTLDGTGTVGATTVGAGTGGIVTNGNGLTGSLTLSSLTFLGAATDNVRLVGGSSNLSPGQIVTGALTSPATAGAVVVNVNAPGLNNGNYNLIQFGTLLGGGLSGFSLGTVAGAGNRQTETLGVIGNDLVLIVNGSLDQYTGVGGNTFQTGGPTNFRLTTNQTPVAFANGDSVLFDDTATGSTAVQIATAVTPASTTFNNSSLAYSLSSTGGFGIGGTGGLTKNGTGALTINTANTYSGGTTLNLGTLNLGTAAAIGSGVLTINGGTLDNTSGATLELPGNTLAINGSFTFAGTNQLNTGTGAVILTGNPTINIAANTLYANNPITGSGSLNKAGGGTLTLAAINTFTGGTNVSGGIVNLNAGGGSGAVRGPLTITNGASVIANVTDAIGYTAGTQVTTLTVNGAGSKFVLSANDNQGYRTNVVLGGGSIVAGTFDANGLPTGRFNFLNSNAETYGITTTAGNPQSSISTYVQIRGGGNATGNFPLSINTASDLLISGPLVQLEGTGSIVKAGTGTLTLTDAGSDGSGMLGNNTYTGGTNIAQGAIRFIEQATFQGAVPINFLGTGTTVIQTNGTLGGVGSTGGPVVVNGTITGGQDAATTGVLTSTGQTWNATGRYLAKVNSTSGATDGSASDVLVMSSLNVSAGFTVTLAPLGTVAFTASNPTLTPAGSATAPAGGSYIVLARDAIATDPNSPFNSSSAIASLNFNPGGVARAGPTDSIVLSSFSDGTYYDLVAEDVAAPEPASLLLLAVAGVPLALGRRRIGRRGAAAV